MLHDFVEQAEDSVDKLSDEFLSMSVSLFDVKTPRAIFESISDGRTVESLLNSEIVLSLSISDGLEIVALLYVDVSK